MASFKSIISKILGVEHIVAISGLVPGLAVFDKLISGVQNAIAVVEVSNPVDGSGAIKEQSVIDSTMAGLEVTQSVLALEGKMAQQDPAKLKLFIAAQVAALNAAKAWKDSFKIVPIVPPTPPSPLK